MNPMALMKMKGMFDKFKANHPKVPLFFNAAAKEIGEGSIIEINVTTAAAAYVDFVTGINIWKKILISPKPSILAASIISLGKDFAPVLNIVIDLELKFLHFFLLDF